MIFNNNRILKFSKKKLEINHPIINFYEINFQAIDNSKIVIDATIPNGKIKGIIIDFPEYKVQNKDYLTLSKYSLLEYAIFSLHIRGQAGKSENNVSCSHFPFLDSVSNDLYYNFVYQDSLDTITIAQTLLPNIPIFLTGVGQGAAISIVCSAYNKNINTLFIADCSLCDLNKLYFDNNDIGYYSPIRNFITDYPDKEQYLLEKLECLDILNLSKNVYSKIYYCHSLFETPYPHKSQQKLIDSLNDVEVISYRLEYKKVFQHSFDDFILEILSKKTSQLLNL